MIFLCRYEKHPEMLPKEAVYRRRLEEGGSEAARTGAAEAAETTTSTAQSRMEGRPKRESIASRIFEKHALPGTLPMIVLSRRSGSRSSSSACTAPRSAWGTRGCSTPCQP